MAAPSRTVVHAVAGLADHVGSELGRTAWRMIDQASISAFAAVTEDEQWIHVDPERAAAGPFGATIAHGFLTLSLCSRILFDILEIDGAGMLVNYGLDRVRFPTPVPSGARIRGRGRLVSVDAIADGVQAVVRISVELEGSPKPACVADMVVRVAAAAGETRG